MSLIENIDFENFHINPNYCSQEDNGIKGTDPFWGHDFYLWTDSNEICTAYGKLKINHILFVKNFWSSI